MESRPPPESRVRRSPSAAAVARASTTAPKTHWRRLFVGAGAASTRPSEDRVAATSSPRRPVPPLRLLREGARQHRVDVPRQLGPNLARPPRLLVDVGPEKGDVGRPRERRLPGQALVEDAGERVDVRARVDVVAGDLLGSDVFERADDVTGSRDAAERARPLGEAEVGEVAVLLARGDGDQDVRRLDVAMDETLLVCCIQGLRDLLEQRDRAGRLERPLP